LNVERTIVSWLTILFFKHVQQGDFIYCLLKRNGQ